MVVDASNDENMDKPPREKSSKATGFVLLFIWLLFLSAPFASFPGMRDRIFVPSEEWNAHAPWAVLQGTLVGFVALTWVVGITIAGLLVIGGRNRGVARNIKMAMFWIWVGFLFLLPLWGWGFERGHLRVWAHDGARRWNTPRPLQRCQPTMSRQAADAAALRRFPTSIFACHLTAGWRSSIILLLLKVSYH